MVSGTECVGKKGIGTRETSVLVGVVVCAKFLLKLRPHLCWKSSILPCFKGGNFENRVTVTDGKIILFIFNNFSKGLSV